MRRALVVLLVLGAGLATWRWWPQAKRTPEQEVRELIARCVEAAEKKDVVPIGDAMAEDFKGPGGGSKQEVKQIILGHVFRTQAGMVIVNPKLEVTVESPSAATFKGTFFFAAGKTKELLQGEGVTRYDIEGRVEKRDGEWLFVQAGWQQ